VIAQIAISVVLIFAASLFVRSAAGLAAADPGFDALTERLEALPEVESVGLGRMTPFSGNSQGGTVSSGTDSLYARWAQTGLGWHETMRSRLLRGRFFTAADAGADVAVVNRRLADDMWGSLDAALGRRITINGQEREVVGVIEDGKYTSVAEVGTRYAYVDEVGTGWRTADLYARAVGDPAAALAAIRRELALVHPDVALERPRVFLDDLATQQVDERLSAWMTAIMGAVALLLAALGTYGMLAFRVERSRREIGVRMALGAQRHQIATMVLRRGALVVAIGVPLGLAMALPLSRLLRAFLYQIQPIDVFSLVLAPTAIAAVVLFASWVPSRRAARVEPVVAIQSE
jgi:hypothetical protein